MVDQGQLLDALEDVAELGERRGLVVREPCPEDRRGSQAVLTATGLLALRDAAPHHLRAVRSTFIDDLDDAEIAVLTKTFERLGERLRAARVINA